MTTVGHSRCEILSVIPAKVVVEVRLDETVACPNDDTIVSPPHAAEGCGLGDAHGTEPRSAASWPSCLGARSLHGFDLGIRAM